MSLQVGDLRVWWSSNAIMRKYNVKDVNEAIYLLNKLAEGDLSTDDVQWNAGGLEVVEADGDNVDWFEWYDEQTGLEIGEYENYLEEQKIMEEREGEE